MRLSFLLVFMLLIGSLQAVNIDNCQTLSGADTTYTLTESPPINSSTCFTISANNVVLDCAGYTIKGNNISATYGVYSTRYNTTVKNCNIKEFASGIFLGSSADSGNFTNNTINLTYSTGIGLQSASGADANNFSLNNISSDVWVNDAGANNIYNTTTQGNIYYFSNGTASWDVYNITTNLSAPNWANNGSNYPFSSS